MTINCQIIPANQDAINKLKGRLRPVDVEEIEDTSGHPGDVVLQTSFEQSIMCCVVMANGEPVLVAGLVPYPGQKGKGVPWLLGTKAMELREVALVVTRYSKRIVDLFHAVFPELENYVGANNDTALRWLQWMGFELGPPTEMEGAKNLYRRLYRQKEGACVE